MNYQNLPNFLFIGTGKSGTTSVIRICEAFQEQLGLVVNEAMASGLPVLISNRCGCAGDLVFEGKNGATFSPEETERLSNLMVKFSSGQLDLKAMGTVSHDIISEWKPERFAKRLYNALQVALQ